MSTESRLAAANRIIAGQTAALVKSHAALLWARDALEWSHAMAFENENGTPVSQVIEEALAALEGRTSQFLVAALLRDQRKQTP